MSELDSSEWQELPVEGENLGLEVRPSNAQYQIGHRYGSPSNSGHVVLLTKGKITFHTRPINPRGTARSPTGRAAIADWREYGKSTGSEVTVREPDGTIVYQVDLDMSSPFVALSNDGNYLAIAPYNGTTRVVDLETKNLIILHKNRLDSRQKPLFVGDNPELQFSRNQSDEPIYTIDLDDNIIWRGNEFSQYDFVEALSLEAGINWVESCQQLYSAYQNGNDDLKQGVAETVADANLAKIDSISTLKTISSEMREIYEIAATEDHRRAAAIPLADTYYRLAREYKQGNRTEDCLQALDQSITYANEALPWYNAKKQLANCYRFKTRFYKKRGENKKAIKAIKNLFELDSQYEVSLTRDADENLRQELLD
jgi:hypothetical protein